MRLLCIAGGIVVGAALGAGLVLLFAPHSGTETQQIIQDRVESIREEGRKAAEARRQELTARFEALKQPEPSE